MKRAFWFGELLPLRCLEESDRVSTHHVGHAGHSRPLQLVREGRQAVGERRLVLELLLLLRVQLLAGPSGTLSVGRGPKRASVAAQSHLQEGKREAERRGWLGEAGKRWMMRETALMGPISIFSFHWITGKTATSRGQGVTYKVTVSIRVSRPGETTWVTNQR